MPYQHSRSGSFANNYPNGKAEYAETSKRAETSRSGGALFDIPGDTVCKMLSILPRIN